MATARIAISDAAEVRALVDDWVDAVRAGDIEAIMACYRPDIVAFDAAAQLRFEGKDAYRKHWESCLAMWPDQGIFEVRDLRVEARRDLAFGHYLSRCGGTAPDGTVKAAWTRGTVCCVKAGGRWQVAHEHFSAPFDMASGKALFDLEP